MTVEILKSGRYFAMAGYWELPWILTREGVPVAGMFKSEWADNVHARIITKS